MKEEKLLSIINEIDDAFIKEAADYKPEETSEYKPGAKPEKRVVWLRYGSLAAACLVIAIFAAVNLLPEKALPGIQQGKEPGISVEKELPTLSVERYVAKAREPEEKLGNPSQEKDYNPWEESAPVESLPVYENIAYAAEADKMAVPAPDTVLEEKLEETASAIGMSVEDVTYRKEVDLADATQSADSDSSFMAMAQTDTGTIMTTCSNFTKIEYSQGQSLPTEYTVTQEEMTSEKAEELTEYLLDEYGKLMGFSDPKASVRLMYDPDGSEKWILAGYDAASENLQEQIVNYNLKRMRFQIDENGQLTEIVMLDNLASGKRIEEYPIISTEEAKALLAQGEYVANSSNPPSEECIEKATLVYLTGPECNIFMPYYAFDVRVDEKDNGLMHYSTYYVPAVRQEYLNKMSGADTQENQGNQGIQDASGTQRTEPGDASVIE